MVDLIGPRLVPLLGVAALIAVLVLARMIRTRRQGGQAGPEAILRGGLGFIWGDRVLAAVLIGTLVVALAVQGVNVVEVYLVRQDLGATATQYGALEVFAAIGTALAALIVGRLTSDRGRAWAIAAGFGGCALALVAISQTPNYLLLAPLVTVLGLSNAVGNGALGPLFLLRTPEAERGQVMASLAGLLSAVSIIALIVGGLVGAWLSPRAIFLTAGLVALPVVLLMATIAIPAAEVSSGRSPNRSEAIRRSISHIDRHRASRQDTAIMDRFKAAGEPLYPDLESIPPTDLTELDE